MNKFDLHDDIYISDKIKSLSSPLTTVINIISVPPKIWRSKTKNKYKPMDFIDVDKDLYTFIHYGKTTKHTPSWISRPRSEIILWRSSLFQQELEGNFVLEFTTDDFTHRSVLRIIHDNWDYFCQFGVARPILDSEFCVNTGDAKTIYCHQSNYGVHDAKIIVDQISQLKSNGWIRDCVGPWGTLLLLATKSYRESCVDINKFVCKLCASYRPLKYATQSFEFSIPHCSDILLMLTPVITRFECEYVIRRI